jgi:hypothetical protein
MSPRTIGFAPNDDGDDWDDFATGDFESGKDETA